MAKNEQIWPLTKIDVAPAEAAEAAKWGSRSKAAVIIAIRNGAITRAQAIQRYSLSAEELASWEAAFDQGGHQALTNKALARRRDQTKQPA